MQRGKDIAVRFPGLFLVHHNLPGSEVSQHAHPEHHLIIPLQGEVSIILPDRTLVCGPGRMIYVAPDAPHTFRSAREKGERLINMIDASRWRKAAGDGRFDSCVLPASQQIKYLGAADDVVATYVKDLGDAATAELQGAGAGAHFGSIQKLLEAQFPEYLLPYMIQYGVYGLAFSKL